MREQQTSQHDEQLHRLAHDVRQCLHVIGMGAEMLASARADESRFAELCEAIEQERKTAQRLVKELIEAAFAAGDSTVK
ncbi:MAG: hypothetical protein L0H73_15625 [Nitrococcus sp.]|nr:hypothetical protein [Nitrococcus sp.]